MRFIWIAIAAVLLAPASAAEPRAESYLGFFLNYADTDTARRTDGSAYGASFLYAWPLTDNWQFETRFTGLVLERGGRGTDFYQQDLGLDVAYRFGQFGAVQPFAIFGLSAIRNDVDLDELDDVSAAANAGIGLTTGPLGGHGLRFRAELRYVHDDYLEGMGDMRLGLGLEIPLAGRNGERDQRRRRADEDGDGVPDPADHCPASLPAMRYDERGCMLPGQRIRLHDVEFDPGTAILASASRAELMRIVRALRGQPQLRVMIAGHTDSTGDPAGNLALSRDRAEAVATYFVLQGIATQRLRVRGFGETQPVASNGSEEGRARNRRIELHFLEE